MKRVKIDIDSEGLNFPDEFSSFLCGSNVYDSSCSPAAKTFFIDSGAGYYLKSSEESLHREALMTEYFHSKGIGARVLGYLHENGRDFLLTERVAGEDCTFHAYLEDPKRLCVLLAERLRELHEMSFDDCPIDRTKEYIESVERGYAEGKYDDSLFEDKIFRDREDAIAFFRSNKEALKSDVLIHGDYCLPNIMLDNWRFSGFIDVGNGGKGDRHIDILWGAWTLRYNLKTNAFADRFFDAYGRDKVDMLMLKTVAAAELFG